MDWYVFLYQNFKITLKKKNYFKVFLVEVDKKLYAMKLIDKNSLIKKKIYLKYNFVDFESYFMELFYEKEVGLLGNECRFLVKLINSFQTEVYI